MNGKKEGSKDGLALIVGGLFILALVFATYNYFNKSSKTSEANKIKEESVFQKETENLNGGGAKTTTETQPAAGLGTGGPVTETQTVTGWVANDYKQGDVKGKSYTVVPGDTLWEIAEGAYGNGAEWTKILEANKASITLLPNGTQALIVPGQVLVLP